MTRKEKIQQTRFNTKIVPLIKELTKLCNKFNMPMLASVQLFENAEEGAHVATHATHPQEMSLPMMLSTSLMNGATQVRIANNSLQLIMPKETILGELKKYSRKEDGDTNSASEAEPLAEHAKHCKDCAILMEEAVLRGERIDNIVVPKHAEAGLAELIDELKAIKLPFIMSKNNIIH